MCFIAYIQKLRLYGGETANGPYVEPIKRADTAREFTTNSSLTLVLSVPASGLYSPAPQVEKRSASGLERPLIDVNYWNKGYEIQLCTITIDLYLYPLAYWAQKTIGLLPRLTS